jgi:hypothetical protein
MRMSETHKYAQVIEEKKVITRAKFTSEDNEQICALVVRFGSNAWDAIAEAMNGRRSKRQLRERWLNYLNLDLDLSYKESEDHMLVALHAQVGPKWAKIASVIGTKSPISVRNRYRSLQSMKARGQKPNYQIVSWSLMVTQDTVPEQPVEDPGEFDVQYPNIEYADSWQWENDSCLWSSVE